MTLETRMLVGDTSFMKCLKKTALILLYIIISHKVLTLIWYFMALGIEMASPFKINTHNSI
jgi:hypothetical protein